MGAERDDTGVSKETPSAAPSNAVGAAGSAAPPNPRVVLVVEDERSIATVVAQVVEDLGYSPVVAAQGRQALEAARERWPALVITDLMMPRMGGAALIAALRDEAVSRGRSAPPILLLTAASPHYAQAAGADAILRKPFNLEELEAAVLRLMAERMD